MSLPRLSVDYGSQGRVRLQATFELPMAAEHVWSELRDFERYACQDLFHKRVVFAQQGPKSEVGAGAGADFALEHRFLGVGFWRAGRILKWRPGRGYAFSDLSLRDKRLGFPHTYEYDVVASGRERSRFRLHVNGQWTARFIPFPVIEFWLGCILLKTALSIRNSLLLAERQRCLVMNSQSRGSNTGGTR